MAKFTRRMDSLKQEFQSDAGKHWPKDFADLSEQTKFMTALMDRRLKLVVTQVPLDREIVSWPSTNESEVMAALTSFSELLDLEALSLHKELAAHKTLREAHLAEEARFWQKCMSTVKELDPLLEMAESKRSSEQTNQIAALQKREKQLSDTRYPAHEQQFYQYVARLCLLDLQANVTAMRAAVDGFRNSAKAEGSQFQGIPLAVKTKVRELTNSVDAIRGAYLARRDDPKNVPRYIRAMTVREAYRARGFANHQKKMAWLTTHKYRAKQVKEIGVAKGLNLDWMRGRQSTFLQKIETDYNW